MATISGRVIFDRDRSATFSDGDLGLVDIPVVLQNISTNLRLTVLTDSAGNYSFIHVPNGEYRITESYSAPGGLPSPGDFSLAAEGSTPLGVNPPITAVTAPPPGVNQLDSVTPNTLFITVSDAELSDLNFFNGPVIYTPIQTILDPCAVISSDNLILAAGSGTLGTFPQGTPANTGAPAEPYPEVTPDFTYVMPNPDIYAPAGGEYTVQNIMNNALSNEIGAWWRIADHTEGNETGRMMVINGANAGAVFFRSTVTVRPDTSYLFSAWILNLFRVGGYPGPQLGVQILDEYDNILYRTSLGIQIPPNVDAPEWKQVGTVINSQNSSRLTIEFLSEGPEAIGNDYAIDDIFFGEIQVPQFIPLKAADRQSADIGNTVRFTVTLTNTCQNPLTGMFFQDILPNGLSFVPESVTVNGIVAPDADPNIGFTLSDITAGETATISFNVIVKAIPEPNPALNQAVINYSYTPLEEGIPVRYSVVSNEVPVEIGSTADIAVVKTADTASVEPGSTLTYTITVTNNGPSAADHTLLTDVVPADLSEVEFSIDGGIVYQPWTGSYDLGTLASGSSRVILIQGTVAQWAAGNIVNTAIVTSDTPDSDLSNNTSTESTAVAALADLSVTKTGCPVPISEGGQLTYTVTVVNHGPGSAQGVTLTDALPPGIEDAEYSLDGGVTFQPWTGFVNLGTLVNDASRTIFIHGIVKEPGIGGILNTAVVSSDTSDPNLDNNTASIFIPVQRKADISIQKTACPNPAAPGQYVTFTLTVFNAGPESAELVTITDALPAEICDPFYSTDQGQTWCPWTGSHTVRFLPPGSCASILIRGKISTCARCCITNTASVSALTPDPDASNNESRITVHLQENCCCGGKCF